MTDNIAQDLRNIADNDLREMARDFIGVDAKDLRHWAAQMDAAAAEIERLRKENARLLSFVDFAKMYAPKRAQEMEQ